MTRRWKLAWTMPGLFLLAGVLTGCEHARPVAVRRQARRQPSGPGGTGAPWRTSGLHAVGQRLAGLATG